MNSTFISVMVFYMVLTYVIFVMGGYMLGGIDMAGNGFVAGSIVSLLLWFMYGKSLVKRSN
jgi:hypothetical protein